MNRLTKTYRNKTYKIFGVADDLPCGENSYDFKNLLIQKLGEYEDLEEQGLLIKLPCKVGDTVYFITKELDIVKGISSKVIDEYIVTEIRGNKYNPLWYMSSSERCVHRDFHPTEIGKTVFLTREEAEKTLEDK